MVRFIMDSIIGSSSSIRSMKLSSDKPIVFFVISSNIVTIRAVVALTGVKAKTHSSDGPRLDRFTADRYLLNPFRGTIRDPMCSIIP